MIAFGSRTESAQGKLLSACRVASGSLNSHPVPASLADTTVGEQAPPNPAFPSRSRGTNAETFGALPQVESAT